MPKTKKIPESLTQRRSSRPAGTVEGGLPSPSSLMSESPSNAKPSPKRCLQNAPKVWRDLAAFRHPHEPSESTPFLWGVALFSDQGIAEGSDVTKRVGVYLRVSTKDQTTDNQRIELERVIAQRGWTLAAVFEDHGISGSKGRDGRPAFDALCKAALRGELDVIAAWSVDRLGRSLQDLVAFMNEMRDIGIALYLHVQGIDSNTAAGKALLQMAGVFAEFEREILRERIHAGMQRARKQGRRIGRPKVAPMIETKVRQLRAQGMSANRIARQLRIGFGTIKRITEAAARSETIPRTPLGAL
jgi:DNA invertase Pin-like site-specific DNA recombinase